jgi:hypothetical protein
MEGHLIHYKNEAGEWVPIPISIIDVYDMYVAYCTENGIDPVEKDTYYANLTNVDIALKNVESMLGNLRSIESLQEFIAALQGEVLPTSRGGTGKNFDSEAAFITFLNSALQDGSYTSEANTLASKEFVIHTVEDEINAIPEDKRFASGNVDPSKNPSSVPADCTMYFQWE